MAFLAGNLRGEGDVLRHLRFHDYALTYRQPAFVEFDFHAQNPASDFRDGARLCWLVDTLVPGSRLMAQAKVPAPATAARAHNLGLALKALQPKCARPEFDGAICVDEILQGDRERTLELLWRAFALWELPRLVPETDLRLEVSRLRSLAGPAVRSCTVPSPASCGIERLDLLLQWMRLVDALASPGEEAGAPRSDGSEGPDAPSLNFDSSLSDGRLLCQLVAFYAPDYLDKARVHSLPPCRGGDASRRSRGELQPPRCCGPDPGRHPRGVCRTSPRRGNSWRGPSGGGYPGGAPGQPTPRDGPRRPRGNAHPEGVALRLARVGAGGRPEPGRSRTAGGPPAGGRARRATARRASGATRSPQGRGSRASRRREGAGRRAQGGSSGDAG